MCTAHSANESINFAIVHTVAKCGCFEISFLVLQDMKLLESLLKQQLLFVGHIVAIGQCGIFFGKFRGLSFNEPTNPAIRWIPAWPPWCQHPIACSCKGQWSFNIGRTNIGRTNNNKVHSKPSSDALTTFKLWQIENAVRYYILPMLVLLVSGCLVSTVRHRPFIQNTFSDISTFRAPFPIRMIVS